MSPIPELQQRQIDRWCERRVPADQRGEYTVLSRWRGRIVTLVERRAAWAGDGPAERPFAQLRYGLDEMWSLYYLADAGRWRPYPRSVPEISPVPLLDDLDREASTGYFFQWLSPC
ncbi:DUF3024 domain-containing protein [Amycolatopsis viridis]|uniref:DUF3024 domain-containing protein n=1 Tax=Amycolatopsis viridis TaxID=185678 RepID=A0ABX0SKI2_9PSEU|nr:hypothetical protein [Amycolatopsis viridis]NIH77494.1 hypothetical protein [Amycolatopsis viridis]